MNLRSVDLNLLVAFDVLMRERHVTRAAQHLGIGQPAMSAALARMRQLFGDDLLVKQGGEMVPTERALAIEPEIRRTLHDLERILGEPGPFDPGTARRTFRIRMSDLLAFLLLPRLCAHVTRSAHEVSFEIAHLSPAATQDALERGDVELAVSTGLSASRSIAAEDLFEDRLVCIARPDHERLHVLDQLDAFVQVPQIRVSQSPIDDRFVDRQLADNGRHRRLVLTLPHWLAVPEIVASSDLIAVMPESIARRFAVSFGVALATPPLRNHAFTWSMYWHRRHASDDGHHWLRDLIRQAHAEEAALPAE
ncbi:MAG: LysR family transcriptional regulator [Methyloligellaceae bacterium]